MEFNSRCFKPLPDLAYVLTIGVVEMSARSEDFNGLRAHAGISIQHPWMQPLFHVHVCRYRLQHSISLSVAYRMAVVAAIAGAQPLAALRIDEDTLPIAPIMIVVPLDHVMPHLFQYANGIEGNPFFENFFVGQPLVVEARCIYRLLN